MKSFLSVMVHHDVSYQTFLTLQSTPTSPPPLPYLGQLGNQFSTYPLLHSLSPHLIKTPHKCHCSIYLSYTPTATSLVGAFIFLISFPPPILKVRWEDLLLPCWYFAQTTEARPASFSPGLSQHVSLFFCNFFDSEWMKTISWFVACVSSVPC